MTYNSSKTGAQVDGAVTDVQAAKAASATDTTTGRLLKVGDFGVGSKITTVAGNVGINTLGVRNPVDLLDIRTAGGPLGLGIDSGVNSPNEVAPIRLYNRTRSLTTSIYAQRDGAAVRCDLIFEVASGNGVSTERLRIKGMTGELLQNGTNTIYHTGNTIVDGSGFIKEA